MGRSSRLTSPNCPGLNFLTPVDQDSQGAGGPKDNCPARIALIAALDTSAPTRDLVG